VLAFFTQAAQRRHHPPPAIAPSLAAPNGNFTDRRLHIDRSRAIAPAYLNLTWDSRLPIAADLARLLHLQSGPVDLNALAEPAETFNATASLRRRRDYPVPEPVNGNVPESSYRFMRMSLPNLLLEVSQRAIGLGPGEAGPPQNPAITPQIRRLGEMVVALNYQPGREREVAQLRNAGYALYGFLEAYRQLVHNMRQTVPERADVMTEWSTDLARTAIRMALDLPLGPDDQPQYIPSRYQPIDALISDPVVSHVQTLRRLQNAHDREIYGGLLGRFMSSIQATARTDADFQPHPDAVRVLGAPANEREGPDVRNLLGGNVVLVGSPLGLVQALRLVPAGHLRRVPLPRPHIPVASLANRRYEAVYPNRGSGTTLRTISWIDSTAPAATEARTVQVSLVNRVHSYSLDWGVTWQPTGGPHSASLGDMRADAWRQMLADRWHAYEVGNRRNSQQERPSTPAE